jgi:hypothetical protein
MKRPKTRELEKLKKERADAGDAHREALAQIDLINNRIRALDEAEIPLRVAGGKDTRSLESELLELRDTELPKAQRRERGMRIAVEQADMERRRYVRDNLDQLLAELRPQEEAAVERLEKARREMIAANAAWKEAAHAREALYRDDPDQLILRQREPLPRHGYEDAVSLLRRGALEPAEATVG